jgi:hypothetical protein
MNLGLSAKEIDGVFYCLQIILGVLVLFSVRTGGRTSLLLLGAAYVAGISFFVVIHFLNRKIVAKVKQPVDQTQLLELDRSSSRSS